LNRELEDSWLSEEERAMRIAVFSDIHANINALDAALADIEHQAVDNIMCLGDLVGYGEHPNEVIEVIRTRGIATIMGNYDDAVGYDRDDCGCAYTSAAEKERGREWLLQTRQAVSEANKAFLRQLPLHLNREIHGRKISFVHGSPRRMNEYLYEDRPSTAFDRVLDVAGADVLVCGHTHLPYHRVIGKRHVVNVGSVGRPKTVDVRACYSILDISDGVRFEFYLADYDRQAAFASALTAA
jgi:putative phosphoesterase